MHDVEDSPRRANGGGRFRLRQIVWIELCGVAHRLLLCCNGACGFRFDPATYSESYPATVPIIIRPPFRKLSGHCSDLIRPHLVVEDQG
ncbi:MAG: hypothetical protein P4M13_06200, partial [Alphaproteobacteria bacterium]|nr:hypothetical protein [Alphaproteobacteria bacterium]